MPPPIGLYKGTNRCVVCGTFVRTGVVCPEHRLAATDPNLDPRSGNLTEVGESRTAGGRPYHGIGGSRVRGSWPERAD